MGKTLLLRILGICLIGWGTAIQARGIESPLYVHLREQAKQDLTRRADYVGSLIESSSLETRRDWVRKTLVNTFGGFPEKTPLNARTVWSRDYEGYRLEGVLYESRPGLYVTANLYLPKSGTPPFPGIVGPCGHSKNGKANDAYQTAWINLAKRGFVVLCFDPVGQGERYCYLGDDGKPRFGPTTEHTMLGVLALLTGSNLARDFIWDGIRSIDYLCSRPEVDPTRVGCTGNSGGGTQTSYLMALETRIKAAAPSCFLTSLERLYSTIGPQDAEQNFVGQAKLGIDHADYVEACLPRPVLICAASNDFFDIRGTWNTFREAKNFYQRYGIPERVDIIEAPDKHGFTQPRRTAVYHWMERWLKGASDYTPEPATVLNREKDLLCTKTGQVALSIENARSLRDYYREEALALLQSRSKKGLDAASLRQELSDVIGLESPSKDLQWVRTSESEGKSPEIEKENLKAEIESGWFLEAQMLTPAEVVSDHVILLLEDILSKPIDPVEWARKGTPVLRCYPRGLLNANRLKVRHPYFGDYPLYFLSLHLDRPLIGQRVADILACVEFLADEFPEKKVRVLSTGNSVPPTLIAAALDERIEKVEARGGLVTWQSLFDADYSKDRLSNVAPGILEVADLPNIVRLIQPREVVLQDCQSPEGETLDPDQARKAYQEVLGPAFSDLDHLTFRGSETE